MNNPLVNPLEYHDANALGKTYGIVREEIQRSGGKQPSFLGAPMHRISRSEFRERTEPRYVARWDLPQVEEQTMAALEGLAEYIHTPHHIQGRRDPFGHRRDPSRYITQNLGFSKTSRGYLLKNYGAQEADSVGIWVCRRFSHGDTTKKKDWLYQGKAFVELREEEVAQLDFSERVVQIASVLAQAKALPYDQLLYSLYQNINRSVIGPISQEQIAGLDDIIELTQWLLFAAERNKALAEHYGFHPESIVLAGVKGTGKTMIAKVLATSSSSSLFVPVDTMDLVADKYLSENKSPNGYSRPKTLTIAMEGIRRRSGANIIVHCDDIEGALIPSEGSGEIQQAGTSKLLNAMSGLSQLGFYLSGSTNIPWDIDSRYFRAGRISQVVHIPLPDEQAREMVLSIHTKGKPLSDDVDLRAIRDATEGFTPADLEGLCNQAALHAAQRLAKAAVRQGEKTIDAFQRLTSGEAGSYPITAADFEAARARVQVDSSSNRSEDRRIAEFCRSYKSSMGIHP